MEDVSEAEKQATADRAERQAEELEKTQAIIGDTDEKDKIQFALELAIHMVTAKSRAGVEGAEGDDPDESVVKVKAPKTTGARNYLGTNLLIKLPFVIGTKEYEMHPKCGVVMSNTQYEQTVLFEEEQEQYLLDKKKEEEELKKAAEAVAIADEIIAEEQAKQVTTIPAPPPGELGNIAPPPGFGVAYVPALVEGGIMAKPVQEPVEVAPAAYGEPDADMPAWKARAAAMRERSEYARGAKQTNRASISGGLGFTAEAALPVPPAGGQRDLTAMMYGGGTTTGGLFDLGAVQEVDEGKTGGGGLFDDEDQFDLPK